MNTEQINLLNSLKGAPACILWALIFHGKPIDRNHLVIATGYNKDTVAKGLQKLEELSLVERIGRYEGWRLTDRIDQFDLPGLYEDEYSDDDDSQNCITEDDPDLELEEDQPDLIMDADCANNSPSWANSANRKAKKSSSQTDASWPEAKISSSEINTPTLKVKNSPSNTDASLTEAKNSLSNIETSSTKAKKSSSQSDASRLEANISPSQTDASLAEAKISPSHIETPSLKAKKSSSQTDLSWPKAKNSPSQAENRLTKAKKSPSPVNSVNAVVEIYPPDSKRIKPGERNSTAATIDPGAARELETTAPDVASSLADLAGDSHPGGLPGSDSQPVTTSQPGSGRAANPAGTNLAEGLDPHVVRAFRSAGLMLTPRTRLLALRPYITPRYVRAHHAQLKADGKASHTGLLVAILESGIPAPELYPNGHLSTCTCDECDRRYRYRLP